jgi:hypothetical protein
VAGGPYTITPAASDGATSLLGNYDITYNSGKLTISPKPITVTADDKSKVYGSADPALTVTVPAGALEQGDSPQRRAHPRGGRQRWRLCDHEGHPDGCCQLRPHGHAWHVVDHEEGDGGRQVEGVRVG